MDKKILEASADKVLAYERSKYGSPQPTVVLALTLWTERRVRTASGRMVTRASFHEKMGGGTGFEYRMTGYPVVLFDRASRTDDEAAEAAQAFLKSGVRIEDLIDDEHCLKKDVLPKGARFEIVNNRHLTGEWAEVNAKEAARREEDARLRHERQTEHKRRAQVLAEVNSSLRAKGFSDTDVASYFDHAGRVLVNVDVLARIVRALGDWRVNP